MNNYRIIAWMDDLPMSAHLAKLSTIYSYDLEFRDTLVDISKAEVLIIDLNNILEKDLKKIAEIKVNSCLTFIGFCEELNTSLIKYFKDRGCDFVFKRHDLIRNLRSILIKILNAT